MSRNRALTREQIKAANDAKKLVEITVPEWGGVVYTCVISAGESMDFAHVLEKIEDKKLSLATQLQRFVVDESGKPLYETVDAALAELVNEGLAGPVRNVLDEALRANGYGTQGVVTKN